MKFQSTQWLWLLLGLLPVLGFVLRDERRRQDQLARFADRPVWRALVPELDPRARARKMMAWTGVAAFLILALARPQWGTHEETIKTTGLDIMVVLDVSTSMETEDVTPSRLKKARHFVKSLAEKLRGDRIGLVAFAGSSYVACPLTTDIEYLTEILTIMTPRVVINQGTDVGIGIDTARKALERGAEEVTTGDAHDAQSPSAQAASRVIVLISDGEDQEEGSLQSAKALRESGAKFFVLGVGTEKGGVIPLRDESGNLIGNKKDHKGQTVISSFHPDALMAVANAGGGRYWNLSAGEGELDEILQEMGALNRSEYAERKYLVYEDRFQWPLAIGILIFLLEISLPMRKLKGRAAVGAFASGLWLFGQCLGTPAEAAELLSKPTSVEAYLENEKGLKAFKEGKIGDAQQKFGTAQALDPTLPELQFNQGVTQMGQGEVEGAARAFEEAARGAMERGDQALQSRSLYNLGGALSKKSDLQGAVRSYLGAIAAAKSAGDKALEEDARKNLQLLIKKREQQKEQEKQEKQEKKDQQKKDQKDSKEQGGDKSQDSKDPKDSKDKDKDKDPPKNEPKQYEDPSKTRKREFKSQKLSKDDADRVMSELSNRERELQAKIKKQNGKPQNRANEKDW